MKVVVTGGRHFGEYEPERSYVRDKMEYIVWLLCSAKASLKIAHGATEAGKGVDWVVDEWAKEKGIAVEPFPVDTAIDGSWPAAGQVRNIRMLRTFEPNLVVAFPGGAGTMGCKNSSLALGITVLLIPRMKRDKSKLEVML